MNHQKFSSSSSNSLMLEHSELTWLDIQEFFQRYRGSILIVFLLVTLGTYTALQFYTEKYDTTAAILVKIGRENTDPPAVVRNTNVFTSGLRREEVVSEIEFLKSPDLLGEVIQKIGVDSFKPVRQKPDSFFGAIKFYVKAVARFGKEQYKEALIALNLQKRLTDYEGALQEVSGSLAVTNVKDTDVISLTLRMASPELSQKVLNELIALYRDRRIQVRQSVGVNAFLQTATEETKAELARAEKNREIWKSMANLSSPKEQKTALLGQIREVSTEHEQTRREIASYTQQLAENEKLLADTSQNTRSGEQSTPNPVLESLKEKLVTLQAQRADLLSKYNEGSKTVGNVDLEITQIQTLIQKEHPLRVGSVTTEINPIWQELQQQKHRLQVALTGLKSREVLQKENLVLLNGQIRRIDSADLKLEQIDREQKIAEDRYLELLKRKQTAEVSEQLDKSRISNVSILTPPTSTVEPTYPRKLLIMGVGLLVGLLLGVGLSMLLHYIDDTVHKAEDLEKDLGLPHLGSVKVTG